MNNIKPTVSVCIMVKNEENNIKECLSSILNIANEIIVVDNGCTDKTIEYAKQYNCLILNGFNKELDQGRNLYLDKAKSDWIFVIDADERFEQKDLLLLQDILSEADPDTWGINIKGNQYIGQGKWSEVQLLKLIRNNKNIRYNNSPIHASFMPSIVDKGKQTIETEIQIHHLDILKNNNIAYKRNRYSELLKNQIAEYEKNKVYDDFYWLYRIFLGLEYIAVGKYSDGEKELLISIDNKSEFTSFAISLLCQLYILTNRYKKVEKYITEDNKEVLVDTNVLGNYLSKFSPKECVKLYMSEIEVNPSRVSNYINLAYLLKNTDKYYSEHLLLKSLDLNPYLSKPIIYQSGYKPNLFEVQSNILFEISNTLHLFHELDRRAHV